MPQEAIIGSATSCGHFERGAGTASARENKRLTVAPDAVVRREKRTVGHLSVASEPAPIIDPERTDPERTDLELIEGIGRASEAHFNELYRRYFQRIYNFVYGRVHNHADSEEIVQETFTIVFSSIHKYSGRSSLLSWVYGIAKNTTNNSLRQSKRNRQRMQDMTHDPLQPTRSISSCTPEDRLSMQHYLKSVVERLEELGTWQVEIFEMRHLQNRSIQEISAITQRSSDSVRSSLYRVKRMLLDTARLESQTTM